MAQNTYNIPELVTGNGLEDLNANFALVSRYLGALDNTVNQQFSKSSIVLYNQPVSEGVNYGCLVYYDADAGCFAPALAKLRPAPGAQGESIEAPEAHVAGLVIDEPSAVSLTANILIGGYFKGRNIVSSCFIGALAGTAGVYYLSPTDRGKAVHEKDMPSGKLRQPVLTYYGDGSLCMSLYYQAQDSHFHSAATLGSNWEAADTLASDYDVPVPEGAAYGYRMDPSVDAGALALGELAPDITAVFYNGMLDTKVTRAIVVNGIRYMQNSAGNGKAMYGWRLDNSELGQILYTNTATPGAGDPAYSDRRVTPISSYTVISASSTTMTISSGGSSHVYTRDPGADVYSYAWALGATELFTWNEYPASGASAYTDVNCLSVAGLISIIYGEQFIISDGILWCKLSTPPEAGSVTLFNHFPFAYGSSVVRSVTSTNPGLLGVSLVNGNCELSPHDWIDGVVSPGPRAISSVTDNVLNYTTVVPALQAGPGIAINTLADGSAVISSNTGIGQIQDAYSLMHNGTTVSSDGTYQYILFPKNRESEVIATLPVPNNISNVDLEATLWCMPMGDSATLSVDMSFIADPSATTNVPMPADMTSVGTLGVSGLPGYVSFIETASGLPIGGGGLVVARLHRAAANSDFKLLRIGFRLRITGATGASESTQHASGASGMYGTGTAGAAISTGMAIMMGAQGTLVPCTSNVAANADMCLGIAVNGGATGSAITYMYTGIFTGISSIGTGIPAYIGETGALTATRTEGMKFIQRVGIGLPAGQLQVALGTAVIQEG